LGIRIAFNNANTLIERTAGRRRVGLDLGPGIRHLLLGSTVVLDVCALAPRLLGRVQE